MAFHLFMNYDCGKHILQLQLVFFLSCGEIIINKSVIKN